MTLNDFFAASLAQNLQMMAMTVADFSDADLLSRPVPGANHGNWQLGHLVVEEHHFMTAVGASMPELPTGFAARYTRETAKLDNAMQFATKAELLGLLEKVRNATIAFARGLSPAQFDAKGAHPQLAPTVAATLELEAIHLTMHLGQLQVLRRKLGKPLLF